MIQIRSFLQIQITIRTMSNLWISLAFGYSRRKILLERKTPGLRKKNSREHLVNVISDDSDSRSLCDEKTKIPYNRKVEQGLKHELLYTSENKPPVIRSFFY